MRRFKGYMTVEASFVVPFVICAFVAIIYFSNYLYDRCVLSQDCYILAFRAMSSANDQMSNDPGAYVLEKSSKVAGNKYFGCQRPYFRAVVRGNTIEVCGQTRVNHGLTRCFPGLSGGGWDISSIQKAKKREYSKHIRAVKRVRDIGSKEFN